MKHLRRNHSQVRLSAFQRMDELFQRSHPFRCYFCTKKNTFQLSTTLSISRELVLSDLTDVVSLCLETDPSNPLPPPREAREALKKLGLETIKAWKDKFGSGYQKLPLAYNYLKQVLLMELRHWWI